VIFHLMSRNQKSGGRLFILIWWMIIWIEC